MKQVNVSCYITLIASSYWPDSPFTDSANIGFAYSTIVTAKNSDVVKILSSCAQNDALLNSTSRFFFFSIQGRLVMLTCSPVALKKPITPGVSGSPNRSVLRSLRRLDRFVGYVLVSWRQSQRDIHSFVIFWSDRGIKSSWYLSASKPSSQDGKSHYSPKKHHHYYQLLHTEV